MNELKSLGLGPELADELSQFMSDRAVEALLFAARAHFGQTRKFSGLAYINHPANVGRLAFFWGFGEPAVMAGFLHDVLEDCESVTEEEIANHFSDEVTTLVVELTEVRTEGNRATRQAAECERLAGVSRLAQSVKCLDIIDNAKDFPPDEGFGKVWQAEKLELLKVLNPCVPDIARMAGDSLNAMGPFS